MQSQLNFQPRQIQKPAEFFTLQRVQTITMILALAVTFFAILELALS
jgi:hypothetical protein